MMKSIKLQENLFCRKFFSTKMKFFFVFLIFSTDSLIITKRAKPRTGNEGIFGNHNDDDHNAGEFLN